MLEGNSGSTRLDLLKGVIWIVEGFRHLVCICLIVDLQWSKLYFTEVFHTI